MNKKVYIEPNTKVVSMVLQHMITASGGDSSNSLYISNTKDVRSGGTNRAREWDWDDEEDW